MNTSKKNRARGMGLIGAAFGLGFIVGPAVGGLLSTISFSTPAYFAAAVAGLTALSTLLFLDETVDTKKAIKSKHTQFSIQEFKRVIKIFPIGQLLLSFLLVNLAFSSMQSLFPLWTERTFGYTATQNGYIFTYVGIVMVITQMVILPKVIKKFKEKQILVYSSLFSALGIFIIPFSLHFGIMLISMSLLAIGNGLHNPTVQAVASESVPKEEFGETLGLLMSSGSLGRIAGPIISGYLFDVYGKDMPYFVSGITIFLVFLYLRKSFPLKRIRR